MIGGLSSRLLRHLACFWMLWRCSSFLQVPSTRFIVKRCYAPMSNSCRHSLFQKNLVFTASPKKHNNEGATVVSDSSNKLGQEVKCQVLRFTPLGAVVLLADEEKKAEENEKDFASDAEIELSAPRTALVSLKEVQVFESARKENPLSVGEKLIGHISHIRESDGKMSVQLRPRTGDRLPVLVKMIGDKLRSSPNQCLPVGDKSSPEEIMKIVGLSKNDFKRAVGLMYKNRIIKRPGECEINLGATVVSDSSYKLGQEVKCQVLRFTPLGAVVLIAREEKKAEENEKDFASDAEIELSAPRTALVSLKEVQVFESARKENPLSVGEKLIGHISHIRESDGKMSVQLRPRTGDRLPVLVKMIGDKLRSSPNQYLPVGDKSSPQEIMKIVGLSKNDFKRAVKLMYKNRIIKRPGEYEINLASVSKESDSL
jgi:predicted RNA-binding protein (virulence factor B family)